MLFKKKASVGDFATSLVASAAFLFSPDTLAKTAKEAHVSLEDQALYGNALWEWIIFGVFVVRMGVQAGCGRDTKLRDAIMDSFMLRLYSSLLESGMKLRDYPELQAGIVQRFEEYESALENHVGGGPMHHLGRAVARRILGGPDPYDMQAYAFGAVMPVYLLEGATAVKNLFKAFKISQR